MSEFDVDLFYETAHNAGDVDVKAFELYFKSFSKVVLWGAGNLGMELGKYLIDMGLEFYCYWDKRAEELGSINGIKVELPFKEEFDKENTLVISCIVNGSLGDKWPIDTLIKYGYHHYLQGLTLYEGIVCPFKAGDKIDFSVCNNSKACSFGNCRKYIKLMEVKNSRSENPFTMQVSCIHVTTRCTLQCKYCGQYMPKYNPKDRVNYPVQNIMADIDAVTEAVDIIGTLAAAGGEPFLHPDLADIVDHMLSKDNIGIVLIITNGVVPIAKKTLERLKNDRVRISFSHYYDFLTTKQKQFYDNNVKMVKELGINYVINKAIWAKPSEIRDYGHAEEEMIRAKNNCEQVRIASSIRDGKFLACPILSYGYMKKMPEFSSDFCDITNSDSLRERFQDCINKPYYEACRYCDFACTENKEIPAGEQIERGTGNDV